MPVPKSPLAALCAALVLALGAPAARASLPVGAPAPDFSLQAALGGKPFTFKLADALARGPVVLYFFPKAFTQGCTLEAHDFAEATPKFAALGATVIGVSHDDLKTIERFSVEACRNKFAVAADPGARVIGAYDAKLAFIPGDMANRISYVIAPDGRVAYVYSSLDPD
ncbi:MAG: peroxiredoxin, partial [Burkholderiales bacterium]|nr:peroxiredoxin [Burkholderiales bacterium]